MDTTIDPVLGPSSHVAPAMLGWYGRFRRRLPWRADPGVPADPYRVWLSEIMLQQTTVATVGPYYETFLARWPTVSDLADADLDDVLHAWAGLGYYARARNLHKCARFVTDLHDGRFPDTEEGLRTLPGIGGYTAAAVAAIAYGRKAVVVDGNVERVMARLFNVSEPLPDSKKDLAAYAAGCVPDERCGDYSQALMDLGATVCTPRRPKCTICPLVDLCAGRGRAEELPAKRAKPPKPVRRGTAFWIERSDGAVLFRRRAERGLLGGMMEPPSTEWLETGAPEPTPPVDMTCTRALPGLVRHTFTHFHLELSVVKGAADDGAARAADGRWVMPDAFGDLALPTVMKKIVRHALKH